MKDTPFEQKIGITTLDKSFRDTQNASRILSAFIVLTTRSTLSALILGAGTVK